ncbi:MAG: hypothetical protein EZS28_030578 [Streblomastix strix]|uniref:Uncharacterized protein n=1 Tax=Streblomastix strix TaxID=222440 RepID=A0A5J4UTA5_9EUKA|nr:MAG: hypothetical protein EZS28_030578 [Streblomastix strix]
MYKAPPFNMHEQSMNQTVSKLSFPSLMYEYNAPPDPNVLQQFQNTLQSFIVNLPPAKRDEFRPPPPNYD